MKVWDNCHVMSKKNVTIFYIKECQTQTISILRTPSHFYTKIVESLVRNKFFNQRIIVSTLKARIKTENDILITYLNPSKSGKERLNRNHHLYRHKMDK